MLFLFKKLFTRQSTNVLPITNKHILNDIGLSEDKLPAFCYLTPDLENNHDRNNLRWKDIPRHSYYSEQLIFRSQIF